MSDIQKLEYRVVCKQSSFDVPANITKKSCYNILQKRFFIRGFSLHFFSIEVGSETNVDHYVPVADEIKVS